MKKLKKKLKSFMKLLKLSLFVFYNKKSMKENWVLIDSKNGKDLGSNMFRIVEELNNNPEYITMKIFVACNKDKKDDVWKMLDVYDLNRAKLIRENSLKYVKIIALVKFIFTDTSLPLWFSKRNGQIITNTWHGTPLKKMGKDVDNRAFDMGNVQKNHLMADYLIYPSDYMKDIMTSAYFLDNLYKGKILSSGYPRNSVFFEKDKGEILREKLGLKNKRVYGYMPTWRGVLKINDSQRMTDQLEYFFGMLDRKLSDEELFLVRLHPFVANTIDYSLYKHIEVFPEGYEPYDVLNACDVMVTDYSSVMFDFANSRKKIVLFVYDKEFYMDERGAYVSIDSLPFPQVRTVNALIDEMRSPKNYNDNDVCSIYCQYDGENVAKKLCEHIVKGEKVFEEESAKDNGKENVLIYSGSLAKNGLTTALLNLLANVDTSKRNYFVTFKSASLRREPERISILPESVGFIPMATYSAKTLSEHFAIKRLYEKNDNREKTFKKADEYYKREYESFFGYSNFKTVIQYHGYQKEIINLFYNAPCRRVIFSHNDMVEEISSKGNQHEITLKRAYHDYEKVAPVTQDIYNPTLVIGENTENIQIVNNCHDYKGVLEKAKAEIAFDITTVSDVTVEELKNILDSSSKKFITIGRFSAEKGHDMLIKAFDKYYQTNPDAYLIIIGGYGVLFEDTKRLAESMSCKKNIIIIKSISNPIPILKKCDLFILSSLYEGLGLVLLEADTLGIPTMSTEIVGPSGFMKEHGGYLVDATSEGLFNGMLAFDNGEVKAMAVDFSEYNKNAVEQFERLFGGEY